MFDIEILILNLESHICELSLYYTGLVNRITQDGLIPRKSYKMMPLVHVSISAVIDGPIDRGI